MQPGITKPLTEGNIEYRMIILSQ